MKNNEVIRIAIAETSVIIRGGLTAALKRLPNAKVQPIELLSAEALHDCLRTQCPEMLIVNPTFGDYFEGHLTSGIKPTIYPVGARFSGDLYQIAYTPGKKKEVIDFLRNLEYKVYGSEDFEYTFLEDDIKAMYTQDRQTATIYSIFAGMAIIISSLGLLGISLFDIRQRYREIAIRKVNGASAKDLYRLLFRKYITVLIIAFVIAIPLAYYLINTYTQDFAVRAPVSIDIFIISLLLVIIISLGTLAYQIQKAAYINPTQIMKTE